ncbi:hypothetical protein [Neoroseomonas oryzicola]|uniref:Uncharacterized protein n=1 Tax=Neoroseomonas oryzicola TaxID=535904 RepID=A0A9X9WJX0_9PROT|nr:hypothetical protein [Neoroseomonas oryzicola]MBR0660630.1 hypothetical protein [Neoroseomonas oryzicola]NKE20011.1 hypothetical protein [Neoroseomonas oryzicola]
MLAKIRCAVPQSARRSFQPQRQCQRKDDPAFGVLDLLDNAAGDSLRLGQP